MIFQLLSQIFSFILGFYFICTLQWYSYKISRVFFHFAKPLWHIYFAILPFIIFVLTLKFYENFAIFILLFYALLMAFWQFKMAKKLVFTKRVLRYFIFLALFSLICFCFEKVEFLAASIVFVVFASFLISALCEKILATYYIKLAKKKLENNKNLNIVLITASYGKTSIKNYLFEILKESFVVQASPRSVNTLLGLVQDINENLKPNSQIYIAEAGARLKGDIKEITKFLNPQFVIIGQIGTAHLEYFKSEQNIRQAKLEALQTSRLKMALLHSSSQQERSQNHIIYDKKIKNIKASLEGLEFELNLQNSWYSVKIKELLGEFNAQNVAAAAIMANILGLSEQSVILKVQSLQNTPHRLKKMQSGGKIIIDDGFNGNFDGMSASYKLVASYNGAKVLVTPGIMEGQKELNIKLSKIINEVFDLVIISSTLNINELKTHLSKPKIIELKSKKELIPTLAEHTKAGDLILFSNDAPEYM